MTTVCVVGLGYIGLPTAAMFAANGFQVVGVDTNPAVVDGISNGNNRIEEPGMATLLQAAVGSGNLIAQGDATTADVFIIAVPTPLTPQRQPDLGYVRAACEAISGLLRKGDLVVVESTVPPGTTLGTVAPLLETSGLTCGTDFSLAHCPERVLPGTILREIVENDRIVGGIDSASTQRAAELYGAFVTGTIHRTDATTAEMAKLAENTYRDVNIALANELAKIAEAVGVDVWDIIELANKHPRVDLHQPGPGVGGHCIPIDPWFLAAAAPEAARLIPASRKINDAQPQVVLQTILGLLPEVQHPKAALLGVTYKANVADTRETPALPLIHGLEQEGVTVAVHDPYVKQFPCPLQPLEEALRDADVAVLLVDHRDFIGMDPAPLGSLMRSRVLLDTRHCLDINRWRAAGFRTSVLGVGDGRE